MKLFFDLRLGYLVQAPGQDSALSSLQGKSGDGEEIILQFGRSSDPTGAEAIITAPTWTAENLAGGTVITVGLKQDGKYSDGTMLATTSTWTNNPTTKTYTGSLNLNTTAINTLLERLDSNASDDVASLACGFEVTFQIGGAGSWRSSVLPVDFTIYHDLIGGSEGTPANASDPTQYLLKSAGIEYLATTTSKTGGTAADLDAIATVGVTVGKIVAFRDLDGSSIMRIYELAAGTDAEASPDIIRPDDYAGSTNEKVWRLQTLASAGAAITGSTGATDNAILRADGTGGSTAQASGITIADGATGTLSGTNSGDVTLGASVADVLDISNQVLAADDPGADRILFWDDSETKLRHLTVGTGLSITGTTLSASGPSGLTGVASSATDVFSVSGSDLIADDPNADRLVFWDDSAGKLTHLAAGGGLNITGTTLTSRPLELSGTVTADASMANNRNRQLIQLDTATGNVALTIDPNSTTAYDDYFYASIMKLGNSNVATIERGAGVALYYNGTDGDITLSNGVVWTIWREGINTWRVISKT
jgi:hypothetical protein